LPSVIRWNAPSATERYHELMLASGSRVSQNEAAEALAARLESLAGLAGLESRLEAVRVPRADLPALAEEAAKQWTGRFNPRPFGIQEALEVYEWAF